MPNTNTTSNLRHIKHTPIAWLTSLPLTGALLPCQYWSYNHNSKPSPASGLAAGADFGGRNMMQVMARVVKVWYSGDNCAVYWLR